jgi:hypothetical protein
MIYPTTRAPSSRTQVEDRSMLVLQYAVSLLALAAALLLAVAH